MPPCIRLHVHWTQHYHLYCATVHSDATAEKYMLSAISTGAVYIVGCGAATLYIVRLFAILTSKLS